MTFSCSQIQHAWSQRPDGTWFETFAAGDQLLLQQDIPPNRPTQTPPSVVGKNAGWCSDAQTQPTQAIEGVPAQYLVNLEAAKAQMPTESGNGLLLLGGLALVVFYFGNRWMERQADRRADATMAKIQGMSEQDLVDAWQKQGTAFWLNADMSHDATNRVNVHEPVMSASTREPRNSNGFRLNVQPEPTLNVHVNPVEPDLNLYPVQAEPRRYEAANHPLMNCPLKFDPEGNQDQANAVRWCLWRGKNQDDTIWIVWGIKKGGSQTYAQARELFQEIRKDWEVQNNKVVSNHD